MMILNIIIFTSGATGEAHPPPTHFSLGNLRQLIELRRPFRLPYSEAAVFQRSKRIPTRPLVVSKDQPKGGR